MISLDNEGQWFADDAGYDSLPSIVHELHGEFVWYEDDSYACPVCRAEVPLNVILKFNFIYPDFKYEP